jgi:hypothetical protein
MCIPDTRDLQMSLRKLSADDEVALRRAEGYCGLLLGELRVSADRADAVVSMILPLGLLEVMP